MKMWLTILMILNIFQRSLETDDALSKCKGQVEILKLENNKLTEDLARAEIKLKDDQITKLRIEVEALKLNLESKIEDLEESVVEELSNTKLQVLEKTHMIEKDVAALLKAPFFHSCAWQRGTSSSPSILTFDKFIHKSSNICNDSAMNLETGTFTSCKSGTYSISWHLHADHGHYDHKVLVYLRKNEEIIPESKIDSRFTSNVTGSVVDQGGRTLLLHLKDGETVDLVCEECLTGIWDITFCINLIHADLFV